MSTVRRTLSLLVLSLALLGASAGFAWAGGEDVVYVKADHRVGDRGTYHMVREGGGAIHADLLRFEDRGETQLVGPEGGRLAVRAMAWQAPLWPFTQEPVTALAWHDAGIMRAIETSSGQARWVRDDVPIVQSGTWHESTSRSLVYTDGWYDCLLVPPMDLDAPCRIPALGMSMPAASIVDEGLVDERGTLTLKRSATAGDDRIEWYMVPDFPYPLRLDIQNGPHTATLRLVGLEQGSDRGRPLEDEPTPQTRMAERTIWGPSDAGVDHPFPLSKAFKGAMTHPTWSDLRDWMGDHYNAYVFMSGYDERRIDGDTIHRWDIHLSDGQAGFSLRVEDRRDALGLADVVIERLDAHRLHRMAPHVDDLPDHLPLVADSMARWSAHGEGRAQAWSHRILAGPDGPVIHVAAGRASSMTWSAGPIALGSGSQSHTSVLVMDADGRALRLDESSSKEDGRLATTPPRAIDRHQQWGAAGMAASTGWQFDGRAASASVAGLLAAVALWPWLKAGGLALFSRIRPHELLGHPVRREIMDLIEAEPGIHFRCIASRTERRAGQVRHHLRKLVEGDLVIRKEAKGYTCFYSADAPRAIIAAGAVLRAQGAQDILAALAARPGASGKEVAAAAGISPATATYHLKRLQEAGLVLAERAGRSLHLRLSPEGRQASGH